MHACIQHEIVQGHACIQYEIVQDHACIQIRVDRGGAHSICYCVPAPLQSDSSKHNFFSSKVCTIYSDIKGGSLRQQIQRLDVHYPFREE